MWLRFIIRSEMLTTTQLSGLLDECTQLCNIIGQSVVTATGAARPEK
jgi:hypothetical protein